MKKIHKFGLIAVVIVLTVFSANAQQGPTIYDFAGGAQSWVKGYGTGTVDHDPIEGVSSDGALTLERLGNNNANIRRGQGGDDTFIVLDRGVYSYIKIVYKNQTKATELKIAGTSRDAGTTGEGSSFSTISKFDLVIESENYNTAYIDISSIPAGHEVTRLDMQVRRNSPDDTGDKIFFDEIEFIASLPVTTSAFIVDPNFEDPLNDLATLTDNTFLTREISNDEAHGGDSSLKFMASGDADKSVFSFFTTYGDLGQVYPVGSTIEIKMWVKTNRTEGLLIQAKTKNTNGGGSISAQPQDNQTTTNLVGAWEELTFTMTANDAFDAANFRFAFIFNNDASDVNTGDVIYVDDLSATVTAPTLSSKKNTLEGVNVSSSNGVINVSAPDNSEVSIYSITGTKVVNKALASGVYIVKVVNNGKQYIKKVIVE